MRSTFNVQRSKGPWRGFTLVEMLVVIGIIAVVTGIAAGFLSRVGRSLAVSAFRGQVSAVLRSARNEAINGDSPATVEIEFGDAASGKGGYVRAITHRAFGMWHFEPGREEEGALGNDITLNGRTEVVPGRIGGAIQLGKGGYGDAGQNPDFDLPEGGTISAWIWPESGSRGGLILHRGNGYKLAIDGDGQVSGSVRYNSGSRELECPFNVGTRRWTHVELEFTRIKAILRVDGVEVDRWVWKPENPEEEMPEIRPHLTKPLRVGNQSRGFIGRVDHVMVMDFSEDERHWVPTGVQIFADGTTARELHFLPSGALDPRVHVRPETITLRSTVTGKIESLRIGLMGDIR